MTPEAEMKSLIERLEKATASSRELDRAIFTVALGRAPAQFSVGLHYYTSSVDTALGLVPEGWEWTLHSDGSGEIYKNVPSGGLPGHPDSTVIQFEGETPALALCIASLKARSV